MTEQEVRRYLRQMKEEDSERAFHSFYNLCYDRLFRIACYFVKHEEWAQEIVLDVFMKLWEQRARLPEVNNIEDYCFILTKNASLNYLEKENRHPTLSSEQLPEVSGQADSPEDTLISEEHTIAIFDNPEKPRSRNIPLSPDRAMMQRWKVSRS